MIRRVGIDFGTSTTVVRVKNYEDDGRTPIGSNALACEGVKFGGVDTVPSLVREWTRDGERKSVCGGRALNGLDGSTLWSGFKMDLESPDSAKAEKAWALTDEFFSFLHSSYREDDLNGSFGDAAKVEETWVSHPVKWRKETAKRLGESASKAGFQNVHLMNEALAAVTSVALRNAGQLKTQLGIGKSNKCRILLVDMGAGTTDLVLGDLPFRDGRVKFDVDVYWPAGAAGTVRGGKWAEKSAELTCGGQEFDRRLSQYLEDVLRQNGAPVNGLLGGVERVKEWKEQNLSPALLEKLTVNSYEPFTMLQQMYGTDIKFSLDRAAVVKLFKKELTELMDLINGCMVQTKEPYVDAVVLVGGGSQWFFVNDVLSGNLAVDGKYVPLFRADKTRPVILPVYRPQETVAQGLVLAAMSVQVPTDGQKTEKEKEQAGPADDRTVPEEKRTEPEKTEPVKKEPVKEEPEKKEPAKKETVKKEPEKKEPEKKEPEKKGQETMPPVSGLLKKDDYAQCLARKLTDLINSQLFIEKKGAAYNAFVASIKQHTKQILELLTRQDNIRIFIRYGDIYISGTVTRADCNEWAVHEEFKAPFPGAANPPGHRQILSYTIRRRGSYSEIDTVKLREKDCLLTDNQKKDLRAAMYTLRKRTEGARSRDEIVAEGDVTVSKKTRAFKHLARYIYDLKREKIQVYYCRPQSFFNDAFVVTDIGAFVCSSAANEVRIALYSWYEMAMNKGQDIAKNVMKTECGEQLKAVLDEFLTRLKNEYQVDYYVEF